MKISIHVNALTGGGAERVAALWARGFADRGHEVTVVIRDDGRPISYNPGPNVNIIRLGGGGRSKVAGLIGRVITIRRLIASRRPDVILGVLDNATMEVYLSTLGLGIPVINTEHNCFERPEGAPPIPLLTRFQKFFMNRLYHGATVLTGADLAILGNRARHAAVLPNPLAFRPLDSVPSKDKIILACGRLDDWHYKGFDLLIKAWGMMACQGIADGWRLVIAGSGSEKSLQTLKGMAADGGVSGTIDFTGFTNDIIDLYRRASIFVLSSRYEAFGMVLIEAMSQGCACVACDYKGRQEEITGEAAICVPAGSAEAIADAITRLIADNDMQSRLGHVALTRSREFMPEKIMSRWDSIFSDFNI